MNQIIKKMSFLIVMCLALSSISVSAYAGHQCDKSCEKKSQEKKSCCQKDEHGEVKADPKKLSGALKKGFTFETADKSSSISFHGRLQTRYAVYEPEGDDNTAHSFLVRRFYFGVTGSLLAPQLTYDLTLTATPSSGSNIYYGNFSYKFDDLFQLTAGLQKIKFNRQEITSSGKQQFVDRSLANERYNLDRSVGLMVSGATKEKAVEYYLSAFNGRSTRANINSPTNLDLGYSARLVWNALGQYGYEEGDISQSENVNLALGVAGAYYNEETAVAVTEDRVYQGALDLGMKYQGFSFQAEAFLRNTEPNGSNSSQTDFGDTVQLGYFIVPQKFEIAARVSSLFDDINDSALNVAFDQGSLSGLGSGNDAVDSGDVEDEHELSFVMNYYVFEQNFKIQGQYTMFLDGQAGGNTTNHLGLIQATLQF